MVPHASKSGKHIGRADTWTSLCFSRHLATTHAIYKEKVGNSCAWLISAAQEIGNVNNKATGYVKS